MTLMLSHRRDDAGARFNSYARLEDSNIIYSAQVETPGSDGEQKRLDVRLASSPADRLAAHRLVNSMYDWRGYGDNHMIPATDMHSTFLATLDDEVVGTVTLAVDSDGGLAADKIFRDEINTYRRVPGASVCELTKLAFDAEVPSKKLLASLFHIVFIYGKRRHRCTDLFIEVNPRHRRFYEAMLGFKPVGELRTNESVSAPSQLMWLSVSDIAARISEYAGREDAASCRSLYPLFLTRADQRGVRKRLYRTAWAQMVSEQGRPLQGGTPLYRMIGSSQGGQMLSNNGQ